MIQRNCSLDMSVFLHCLQREPWVKSCRCSGWVRQIQATHTAPKMLPRIFQKTWKDVSPFRRSWIWFLCITPLYWSVAVQKHALIKACFPLLFYFVLILPFLFINHSYIQKYKWKLSGFPLKFKLISFAFRTSLNFTLLPSSFLTYWRGLHTNFCSLLILQECVHFFVGGSAAVLLMKRKQ